MTIEERTSIEGRTLLLFDGLCGLCHGAVRFLMRHDSSKRLLYAPLESCLGQEMLARAAMQPNPEGIVLIEAALTPRQAVTMRSDAAIRALRLLRGAWPLAGWLLAIVPRWLRELAYGWIAKWRYKVFGSYRSCPLPSLQEHEIILGAGD